MRPACWKAALRHASGEKLALQSHGFECMLFVSWEPSCTEGVARKVPAYSWCKINSFEEQRANTSQRAQSASLVYTLKVCKLSRGP